jgi:hypothetical protein
LTAPQEGLSSVSKYRSRLVEASPVPPVHRSGRLQVKRRLCYGFRRIGKEMGQTYQCRWRICREIIFFFFQVRILHVLCPFVTYLLTLPGAFHGHRGKKRLPANPRESSRPSCVLTNNPTLREHIPALSWPWLTLH